MPDVDPPILGLSGAEAAQILGVTELHVARLVVQGVLPRARPHQRHGLDRDDVEQLALARYRPGHPYWASTVEAAAILGVGRERVRQLVEADRLPAVDHDGRRYYRRHQVEVIAHARHSRQPGAVLRRDYVEAADAVGRWKRRSSQSDGDSRTA